jgi:hypothetical protein
VGEAALTSWDGDPHVFAEALRESTSEKLSGPPASVRYRGLVAPATRIRIIACPPGEAPLSVRLAWVGLELPLAPRRATRRLAMTSGVISAPRGLWQCIAALFLGRSGVQTGYSVNALEAVNLLQAKDPVAAAWWREHCGHLLDGKRWFLFPTASCEEGS